MSKTSQYRGVVKIKTRPDTHWKSAREKKPWEANISISDQVGNRRYKSKSFETEREAALQYDKWVLELQLKRPLNILKPKAA